MADNSNQWRRRMSALLMVATFLLTLIAGPMMYVASVFEDEDAFVSVARDVTAHPEVRGAVANIATTLTLEVVATEESLTEDLPDTLRTLAVPITQIATTQLTEAAFALLDTDLAVDAQESALREVHRQFNADGDTVVIDLGAVLVRTNRELGGAAVGAGVAKLVSGSDTGTYTLSDGDSSTGTLLTVVRAIPDVAVFLLGLVLVCLVAAIVVAPNRRRALVTGGLVLAGSALVGTFLVSILLFVVLAALSNDSTVGAAIAEVVSTDMAQFMRGTVILGVVLAAIGLLLGNRPSAVALRALPSDLWHRRPGTAQTLAHIVLDNPAFARVATWLIGLFVLTTWSMPTTRVVVTISVLTAAAAAFVGAVTRSGRWAERVRAHLAIDTPPPPPSPTHGLRVNLAISCVLLFLVWPGWDRSLVATFLGLFAVLQMLPDLPAAWREARDDGEDHADAGEPSRARRYGVAGAVVALAAGVGLASTGNATEHVSEATACNGYDELCTRRVDQVVFAGSHNAMSSTDLGWDLALQTGDMVTQLDHGVRALLIDALYWRAAGPAADGDEPSNALIEAALSDDKPRAGTWLCHGFCALGATDLTAGLAEVNVWLDQNPREVLVIVVQDEVSFADLEEAFVASGLRDKAYTHQAGQQFPTLEQLIDSGERILVFGENQGEPGEWFQNGYAETFTETPFTFALQSDFSCVPNRGDDANPLFLINHWLTTGIPVREAAISVNSREKLMARVDDCLAERGRLPTVLATDFVETGDLISVVAELNNVADN